MSYLLLDIGGTSTKAVVIQDLESITNQVKFPTPRSIEAFFEELPNHVDVSNITHIVAGITGTFDQERKILLVSPHLPDWSGENIQKRFSEHYGATTIFRNDTELVGLGEAVYGAGKKFDLMVYITISTGFGGVKIERKTIDDAFTGFEPGHQILKINGNDYTTLEKLVSGSGIDMQIKQQKSLEKSPEFWEDVHRYTAIGLYNICLLWSPKQFILGGGMINAEKIKVEKVSLYFDELYTRVPIKPGISQAELGDFGGLWGALHLLHSYV